ncbi:MAG: hypothetical protein GY756_21430 [bacterium]|nr:hypothetical protein [bacterium]
MKSKEYKLSKYKINLEYWWSWNDYGLALYSRRRPSTTNIIIVILFVHLSFIFETQ